MSVVLIRYYKMDVTRCLRENLTHKTVIEYPTLHVCMAQSSFTTNYVVYDPLVDGMNVAKGHFVLRTTNFIVQLEV